MGPPGAGSGEENSPVSPLSLSHAYHPRFSRRSPLTPFILSPVREPLVSMLSWLASTAPDQARPNPSHLHPPPPPPITPSPRRKAIFSPRTGKSEEDEEISCRISCARAHWPPCTRWPSPSRWFASSARTASRRLVRLYSTPRMIKGAFPSSGAEWTDFRDITSCSGTLRRLRPPLGPACRFAASNPLSRPPPKERLHLSAQRVIALQELRE